MMTGSVMWALIFFLLLITLGNVYTTIHVGQQCHFGVFFFFHPRYLRQNNYLLIPGSDMCTRLSVLSVGQRYEYVDFCIIFRLYPANQQWKRSSLYTRLRTIYRNENNILKYENNVNCSLLLIGRRMSAIRLSVKRFPVCNSGEPTRVA